MASALARPDPAAEALLWQRMRGGEAPGFARQQLLDLHLPYARTVAATYYARRFSDEVGFDDYLQYASLGLLEAMERYDPAHGAQFRTFAARRMHGAILNGLERATEKQQQIAARQRLRAERVAAIRDAAQAQDAAGGEQERLMRFVAESGIGLALAWLLEGTGMIDAPERGETVPFYRQAELRQLREQLLRTVDELPPQERAVVRYHYLQDMPFESVATMMKVTRGRISQIHRQALLHLRDGLGSRGLDVAF